MTDRTIAPFQISTDEDFRFQYVWANMSMAGRVLRVIVKERATNTVRATLTLGNGLTLTGTDTVTGSVAQATSAAWPRGEYEVDLHDITGGSNTRLVGGRAILDHPGNLVYGVRGNKATVTMTGNQAIVTGIGGIGPPGPANVITIGDVDTLETGEPATASLGGTSPNQVLNLGLPKGNTGTAATVAVGSTTTGAPGSDAEVTNSGTSSAAVLDFTIPAGVNATIEIGDVTTGAPGSAADVTNSGTTTAAVLDFTIPRGDEGEAATVAVGTVTTSLPGSDAVVTNSGTSLAAVLNFVLPRGNQGPPGSVVDGDKGDITVSGGGTVWTVDNGAITTSKIADSAVTTAKIGDDQVTTAKIVSAALKALGGLSLVADKLPYGNGTGTAALTDFTSQARTLLGRTSFNAMLQDLGGPWETVQKQTVSGSPGVVEFAIPASALEHGLLITGIRPATNDTNLLLQVQTGGTTWQTSSYAYGGRVQGTGGGADIGSSIDSYTSAIVLTRSGVGNGVGNSAGHGFDSALLFVPGDTNQRRRLRGFSAYTRSDGVDQFNVIGGSYGATTVITGVRLSWVLGNFANVGAVSLIRRAS